MFPNLPPIILLTHIVLVFDCPSAAFHILNHTSSPVLFLPKTNIPSILPKARNPFPLHHTQCTYHPAYQSSPWYQGLDKHKINTVSIRNSLYHTRNKVLLRIIHNKLTGLQNPSVIILHLLGYLFPKLWTAFQECQHRSDTQIRNGYLITVTELRILQIFIHQDWEVFIHELCKRFLRILVLLWNTKDNVCNGRDASVHTSLTPIHNHVNLGT